MALTLRSSVDRSSRRRSRRRSPPKPSPRGKQRKTMWFMRACRSRRVKRFQGPGAASVAADAVVAFAPVLASACLVPSISRTVPRLWRTSSPRRRWRRPAPMGPSRGSCSIGDAAARLTGRQGQAKTGQAGFSAVSSMFGLLGALWEQQSRTSRWASRVRSHSERRSSLSMGLENGRRGEGVEGTEGGAVEGSGRRTAGRLRMSARCRRSLECKTTPVQHSTVCARHAMSTAPRTQRHQRHKTQYSYLSCYNIIT